jgi:hypothetical protein
VKTTARSRVFVFLALALLPLARAAWTPPAAAQLARLERALAPQHAQWDPTEQLPKRPFSSPGYHTTLKGGFVHSTRDAFNYAVGLLDTGKPEHRDRACAILRRAIALQDSDPASKTFGIWSWFLEEPLAKMSPPDFNWADFNGVALLQVARDHRARLPADLAAAVDTAILRACAAIKKRNVGPGYTNIAIMGSYVTLYAGELLRNDEFLTYGLERLTRFHAFTRENGTFEEYNSPTYTIIALLELSRLKAHVRTPAAQPLIDDLVRHAWEEIAKHFHAPTRQWAGPHSRAYRSLNSESTLALIQRATAGRVAFGIDTPDRDELRLPLHCPPDLEPLFASLATPRTVTETFIKRSQIVGTTYLHPQFALGSINRGDLWNQRRPLLAHFGTAAAPGYLQLRFLKNDYDFSSAIFRSAQREGLVVGAVNFITNGGDTHISLDKVKAAKIRARDLRLRFELGGPASKNATLALTSPTTATLTCSALTFHVTLARARLGALAGKLTTGQTADLRYLDVEFYHGDDREFDLAALGEAITAFALSVGPHGPVTLNLDARQLTLTCDDLSVTAATKPTP